MSLCATITSLYRESDTGDEMVGSIFRFNENAFRASNSPEINANKRKRPVIK